MKIRIQRNSIRLRLSKTEVEKLHSEGHIEENTSFGNASFSYAVKSDTLRIELAAQFENGCIVVLVPEKLLVNWPDNNVIGFDAKMPVSANETLYILVEKDFKCLDNTTEDQSDNFDNPKQTC